MHCDVDQEDSVGAHLAVPRRDRRRADRPRRQLARGLPRSCDEIDRRGLGLTVCPISNSYVAGGLKARELKTMLDHGMRATVNSDDPAYFPGYVNENLCAVQGRPGLTGTSSCSSRETRSRSPGSGRGAGPLPRRARRLRRVGVTHARSARTSTRRSISRTRSRGSSSSSRPRRPALTKIVVVLERRRVDRRRQPLPLAERRDAAEHVSRRPLDVARVGHRAALAAERASGRAGRSTGTIGDREQAVEVDDERLEHARRLDPEPLGRLEAVRLAFGSCSYSCIECTIPACSAAAIAGVGATARD